MNTNKRKMDGNNYLVNDLDWIKEQILKTYVSDLNREMFIHADKSNYSTLGYVFFSVEGSPPKGCAVYSPEHEYIIIIDAWGKTKKYKNTTIKKELLTDDYLRRLKILKKL